MLVERIRSLEDDARQYVGRITALEELVLPLTLLLHSRDAASRSVPSPRPAGAPRPTPLLPPPRPAQGQQCTPAASREAAQRAPPAGLSAPPPPADAATAAASSSAPPGAHAAVADFPTTHAAQQRWLAFVAVSSPPDAFAVRDAARKTWFPSAAAMASQQREFGARGPKPHFLPPHPPRIVPALLALRRLQHLTFPPRH